jgi:hypothetical protein
MNLSLAEIRPFIAILLAILIVILFGWTLAQAQTRYAAPDISEYYASLKQPDNPLMSCCGWGDAYFADKTDSCGPQDGPNCALVAIITDDRPDRLELPNGQVLTRPHLPVGTRIAIPPNKLRKPAIFNPTDTNIVFVAVRESGNIVYCWEPAALI